MLPLRARHHNKVSRQIRLRTTGMFSKNAHFLYCIFSFVTYGTQIFYTWMNLRKFAKDWRLSVDFPYWIFSTIMFHRTQNLIKMLIMHCVVLFCSFGGFHCCNWLLDAVLNYKVSWPRALLKGSKRSFLVLCVQSWA